MRRSTTFLSDKGNAVLIKEGQLSKNSPSMFKGWQKRTFRLYPAMLLYSEPGEWNPQEKQCIYLAQMQVKRKSNQDEVFELVEKVRGSTDGSPNSKQQSRTYKLKGASASESTEWCNALIDAIAKIETNRGAERHGANADLCKMVTPEQRQQLFFYFSKHDKDGSGSIDLQEFTEMCKELGAELNEEQAAKALAELDKDGNGSCDFEEFLWFWTATPECGGYDSMTLQFLKMKLDVEAAARQIQEFATTRLVHALTKASDEKQDCRLKLAVSINPGANQEVTEAKMTANLMLGKMEDYLKEMRTTADDSDGNEADSEDDEGNDEGDGEDDDEDSPAGGRRQSLLQKMNDKANQKIQEMKKVRKDPKTKKKKGGKGLGKKAKKKGNGNSSKTDHDLRVVFRFAALSAKQAKEITEASNVFLSQYKEQVAKLMPGTVAVAEECIGDAGTVVLTLNLDEQAFPAGMDMTGVAKAVDQLAQGFKQLQVQTSFNFDINDIMKTPDKPLDPTAILRSKSTIELAVSPQLKALMLERMPWYLMLQKSFLKMVSGGQVDMQMAYDTQQAAHALANLTGGALQGLLEKLTPDSFSKVSESFFKGTEPQHLENTRKLREAVCKLRSVESISLEGLPGTSGVHVILTLTNVNPFPLLRYATKHLDEKDTGKEEVICRALPTEELERLREEFNKHDADGSGCIDLQEFRDMCGNLGVQLTEEELKRDMALLDKDGNGSCSFDEFVQFWSSTEGLGGYNTMGLQFMKMKIAENKAFSGLKNFLSAFPSDDGGLHEGVTFKTSLEFSPGMTAVHPKMYAEISHRVETDSSASKSSASKSKSSEPRVELQVEAFSPQDAARIAATLNTAIAKFKEPLSLVLPGELSLTRSSPTTIVLSTDLSATVQRAKTDPTFAAKAGVVIDSLQRLEINLGFANDCEDLLAVPGENFEKQLGGIKVTGDVLVSPAGKDLWIKGSKSPVKQAVLELLAGVDLAFLLGYHDNHLIEAMAMCLGIPPQFLKEITIEKHRQLYEKMAEKADGLKPELIDLLSLFRTIAQKIKAIASIAIKSVPLGTENKETIISFENFNPLPLVEYVFEPLYKLLPPEEEVEIEDDYEAEEEEPAEGEDGEESKEKDNAALNGTGNSESPDSNVMLQARKVPKKKAKPKVKPKAKAAAADGAKAAEGAAEAAGEAEAAPAQ